MTPGRPVEQAAAPVDPAAAGSPPDGPTRTYNPPNLAGSAPGTVSASVPGAAT